METNNTGRFAILLAVLAATFILTPLADQLDSFPEIQRLVLTGILLAAVFAVSRSRRVLAFSVVGGFLAISVNWAAEIAGSSVLVTVSQSVSALFVLYIVGIILRIVSDQDRVDLGTVLGGICVYLLLVVSFTQLHGLLDHLQTGAYLSEGTPLPRWTAAGNQDGLFATLLYFSLTTITTLGYGDIVPAVSTSRILAGAEAVIGQLYLAVFIGRLVGLYTAQSIMPRATGAARQREEAAGADPG